jgi:PIN domain nuclease of toxin-antitoxin system
MRLLLDTATLIHAVQLPERLSKRAAFAVQNSDNALEISAISITEIAIKLSAGKLAFTAEILSQAMQDLGIRILPFGADHALQLFDLPLHHRDPFDRQIIAQALVEKIPIVTPDTQFKKYAGLRVIW